MEIISVVRRVQKGCKNQGGSLYYGMRMLELPGATYPVVPLIPIELQEVVSG
jgi:hypothetical protein